MSFTSNILHLLSLFPRTAPIAEQISRMLPLAEAAGSVAVQGFKQGGSAIAAAEAAAPDLAAAVKNLAVVMMQQVGGLHAVDNAPPVHVENVARIVLGFPRMSLAEERAWMERFSPLGQDSTSGSG